MTALHPGKKRANANTVPMAHASATDHAADRASAQRLVSAQDADADAAALEGAAYTDDVPPPTKRARRTHDDHDDGPEGVDGYFAERERIVSRERDIGFDGRCRRRASPLEHRVEGILARLRLRDAATVYEAAPRTTGHAGQTHRRFAGDHFLGNVDLIGHTALFDVARMMPKGAHLHVHFNACLDPRVLLGMAAGMERMCITSDVALLDGSAFDRCEIRFGICCPDKEDPGDIFSADYRPRQTMRFSDFRARFSEFYPGEEGVDDWLVSKVVFHEGEAHHARQTAVGAWERFNARTRMMKGLFNYETAFRRYTRLCLADFARDGIQYAEIRPNFMASNQLLSDDGTALIDNWGMMERIIDEAMRFVADEDAAGRFFGGVKVIYCTPRSFSRAQVKAALDECLQFKLKWPRWIAGFDLVGEESAGFPLKEFVPELLQFRRDCAAAGVEVPLLLHCGETLDLGTDTDGNLVDALLLGAPRIGHGFALARHPYVMQMAKARGVCVELCPISNEVLGLTPRVGGHTMYELLANNVHCTVSSDNGTMFRSSLSHDFYQVMVGKADMGLAGWKQLVLWSMEHACLDDEERGRFMGQWDKEWQVFLQKVVDKYGEA